MHIVHGKLRKAPFIKTGCGQDGQSTMFIIELSEVVKDRQTGEKSYTNYSAAIFAKSPAQIDYYYNSLVEGNFVVVNCEKLKVDVSDSNGKQYIKLQMENARLEGAGYIQAQQQSKLTPQPQPSHAPAQTYGGYQQPAPQQQGDFAQQPQQAPAQQGGLVHQQAPSVDFDDDIPF